MKAWEIRERFGLESLHLVEREAREPGRGEARLRLLAMSLNYRDLLVVQGHCTPRQPLPLVPGSDAVGEVIAVGEGVHRFKVGERACPIFATGWIAGRPSADVSRT